MLSKKKKAHALNTRPPKSPRLGGALALCFAMHRSRSLLVLCYFLAFPRTCSVFRPFGCAPQNPQRLFGGRWRVAGGIVFACSPPPPVPNNLLPFNPLSAISAPEESRGRGGGEKKGFRGAGNTETAHRKTGRPVNTTTKNRLRQIGSLLHYNPFT